MYKLIINEDNEKVDLYVYENDELVEQYTEKKDRKRLEGNIYVGRVSDVISGMQSAFIDVGEEKKALIYIRDLLPKISDTTGNTELDIDEYNIADLVQKKDKILVQIKKDCTDQKGPRVTKDIKLTGKYVVIMPFSKFVTISKKIENEKRRNELKKICKKYLEEDYGIIIRTSAENTSVEEIAKDIEILQQRWNDIAEMKISEEDVPKLVWDNGGIVNKIVTDLEPMGLTIITNSQNVAKRLKSDFPKIKILVENTKVDYHKARRVDLKCGGFITIDKTEAFVTIDVNSGRYLGKNNLEQTVMKVNEEATCEIAKQIRLQDIGGIIVVDYIDMENEGDKEKIFKLMNDKVKKDRSKVQVVEFTKLGLLEMTRKHILGR